MYTSLYETISKVEKSSNISLERLEILQPLIDFVQQKVNNKMDVNINFICTHNSRRSHLAQIWAQIAAEFFKIPNVICYSGGTEVTAIYPAIIETLKSQGLEISKIAEGNNPVYAIKFNENSLPIIGFSKTFDNKFNPTSNFVAVLNCNEADAGCPFIGGAEKRIPIPYQDPKISDNTPFQAETYKKTSLEIAIEMWNIFSRIKIS